MLWLQSIRNILDFIIGLHSVCKFLHSGSSRQSQKHSAAALCFPGHALFLHWMDKKSVYFLNYLLLLAPAYSFKAGEMKALSPGRQTPTGIWILSPHNLITSLPNFTLTQVWWLLFLLLLEKTETGGATRALRSWEVVTVLSTPRR